MRRTPKLSVGGLRGEGRGCKSGQRTGFGSEAQSRLGLLLRGNLTPSPFFLYFSCPGPNRVSKDLPNTMLESRDTRWHTVECSSGPGLALLWT
jgi:hypothetical protein